MRLVDNVVYSWLLVVVGLRSVAWLDHISRSVVDRRAIVWVMRIVLWIPHIVAIVRLIRFLSGDLSRGKGSDNERKASHFGQDSLSEILLSLIVEIQNYYKLITKYLPLS